MSWISCKERLPENDDDVLVCDCNADNDYSYPYTVQDSMEIAFFIKTKNIWISKNAELEDGEFPPLEYITHWMPLPEKPAKEYIKK